MSLRRRLFLQMLGVAAVLSVALYLTVRTVAERAAEATQDNILAASATAIAEAARAADQGILVDIPYAAFAMLGAVSEDRVFYRILANDETITGYEDLPMPGPGGAGPAYLTSPYRDTVVRIVRLNRQLPVDGRPVDLGIVVAQTRLAQDAIARRVANVAAGLGIGFFLLAGLLGGLAAQSTLRPLRRLAGAVSRRGPSDLRPVDHSAPSELQPLLSALNGFIGRLRAALDRTETLIAEAAHHVRTPLATVRIQTEIALRNTDDDATRRTLRAVIRAVEESARSAGQLLDHAMVSYRSDHMDRGPVDLARRLSEMVHSVTPAADLRDIDLHLSGVDQPAAITGDEVLIDAALRNLLDNAVKYSPADARIEAALAPGDGWFWIEIRDRGRGIGEAGGAELATRFRRGANVGDIVGSGLGLSIVEEVARAHGGRFSLENREGGGTCARLELPRT
ncbi:HAMP domain-containing protein [Rhodobacteraceae bacterium KN286]|uniref:histidine kinase n=2 Tax=Oceanomicrobium pacificus TaxID=2692916 RepID=A0A6B0U700_9RHOB|nr:HAMP domain-containing protein [Oceanomicrobium pacificus]